MCLHDCFFLRFFFFCFEFERLICGRLAYPRPSYFNSKSYDSESCNSNAMLVLTLTPIVQSTKVIVTSSGLRTSALYIMFSYGTDMNGRTLRVLTCCWFFTLKHCTSSTAVSQRAISSGHRGSFYISNVVAPFLLHFTRATRFYFSLRRSVRQKEEEEKKAHNDLQAVP